MRINLPILQFNLGLLYSLLTSPYGGFFYPQLRRLLCLMMMNIKMVNVQQPVALV